jgi:hypothetical protein
MSIKKEEALSAESVQRTSQYCSLPETCSSLVSLI